MGWGGWPIMLGAVTSITEHGDGDTECPQI